jgi:hypothetical protein
MAGLGPPPPPGKRGKGSHPHHLGASQHQPRLRRHSLLGPVWWLHVIYWVESLNDLMFRQNRELAARQS